MISVESLKRVIRFSPTGVKIPTFINSTPLLPPLRYQSTRPLLDLLEHAEWINRQSEGAFDPTLAPVINLWGFGPVGETRSTIPTGKQILEAKKLTGMDKFKILPKGFIQKTLPALQLDFSGSAKGEIIDQVCTLLQTLEF